MASTVTSATGSNALYDQLNASTAGTSTADASSDRFLKLLVAQMQNQDPLAPMDNAQVTSQMAQINTVSGIEKLNTTVGTLSSRFAQLQSLQGAALVGKEVLIEGNGLVAGADGKAEAAFDLAGAADNVKVEVLSPSGRVIDTIDAGAESAGRHRFSWDSTGKDASGATFRVVAKSGATGVTATPLMADEVVAVSSDGDTLSLELKNAGSVPYSRIKSLG